MGLPWIGQWGWKEEGRTERYLNVSLLIVICGGRSEEGAFQGVFSRMW